MPSTETSVPTGWTTTRQLVARVRRRWDDGSLIASYLRGEPMAPLDLPLKGPAAREVAAAWPAVQAWQLDLVRGSADGRAFTLEFKDIGGRGAVGRNAVPARARIEDYAQVWRLLGVADAIRTLDALTAASESALPEATPWVVAHPFRALEVAEDWAAILRAARWLTDRGGRGLYLRQIDAVGVDTKLVERHRPTLAALLDRTVPPDRIDEKHSRRAGFAQRYGFLAVPRLVRLRLSPEIARLVGLHGVTELAVREGELTALPLAPRHVLIIENQVTYLSAPVPDHGITIWGSGYDAAALGRVPWLREATRVTYAGDLDSHGFAILSLLRSRLPQTRSVLMDRATLLGHRERWGREDAPTRAHLAHLTEAEQSLYRDLVEDVYAPAVRLEQERIGWDHAHAAFTAALR